MVVNLVRSGRKQPQLFSASAGGTARHPPSSGDMDARAAFRCSNIMVRIHAACLMRSGSVVHCARPVRIDGVAFERATAMASTGLARAFSGIGKSRCSKARTGKSAATGMPDSATGITASDTCRPERRARRARTDAGISSSAERTRGSVRGSRRRPHMLSQHLDRGHAAWALRFSSATTSASGYRFGAREVSTRLSLPASVECRHQRAQRRHQFPPVAAAVPLLKWVLSAAGSIRS